MGRGIEHVGHGRGNKWHWLCSTSHLSPSKFVYNNQYVLLICVDWVFKIIIKIIGRTSDRPATHDPIWPSILTPPTCHHWPSPAHTLLLASSALAPNAHHPCLPLFPSLPAPAPASPPPVPPRQTPLVPSLTFTLRLLLDARASSKDLERLVASVEALKTPSRTTMNCLIRMCVISKRWTRRWCASWPRSTSRASHRCVT